MTVRPPRRRAWRVPLAVVALGGSSAALANACAYEVPEVVTPLVDSGGTDVIVGDGGSTDASDADADADAATGTCNPIAPFGTPVLIPELADPNVTYESREPRLSADELTVYFAFGPQNGTFVLFTATRPSMTATFGAKAPIAGLTGGSGSDNNITVSADGLVALLSSNRTQGSVNPNVSQLWSTSRPNASAAFATPVWSNTGFGSQNGDYDPFFIPGAGGLFYSVYADLNTGILKIKRSVYAGNNTYNGASGPGFAPPNAAASDRAPVLTPDELRIFYASNAGLDGGVLPPGNGNIWTSARPSSAVGWPPPIAVAELVNFGTYPRPGWVSANGCRLYLTSNKSGRNLIYVATRGK